MAENNYPTNSTTEQEAPQAMVTMAEYEAFQPYVAIPLIPPYHNPFPFPPPVVHRHNPSPGVVYSNTPPMSSSSENEFITIRRTERISDENRHHKYTTVNFGDRDIPAVTRSGENQSDSSASQGNHMTVFIMDFEGNSLPFKVGLGNVVHDLKRQIEEKLGICKMCQRLIYAGKELTNDGKLATYGIGEMSNVHLCMRLLGGVDEQRLLEDFIESYKELETINTLIEERKAWWVDMKKCPNDFWTKGLTKKEIRRDLKFYTDWYQVVANKMGEEAQLLPNGHIFLVSSELEVQALMELFQNGIWEGEALRAPASIPRDQQEAMVAAAENSNVVIHFDA